MEHSHVLLIRRKVNVLKVQHRLFFCSGPTFTPQIRVTKMLLVLKNFWEISAPCFSPALMTQPPTCVCHHGSFPVLPPLIRKCTSSLLLQLPSNRTTAVAALGSNQHCFHFPLMCCFTTVGCIAQGGIAVSKNTNRPYFCFCGQQRIPASSAFTTTRLTAFVRSYTQGAMIVQINVHVQY